MNLKYIIVSLPMHHYSKYNYIHTLMNFALCVSLVTYNCHYSLAINLLAILFFGIVCIAAAEQLKLLLG